MTYIHRRDLCWSFRELAQWTMGKIGRSWRHGVSFNEETITESLLLKLAERHSRRGLLIRAWTKPEEGTGTMATGGLPTGADWDFWIRDWTGRGIHLRVQAKRQFRSGRYESLNGAGHQIKDLRNNCGTAIPIYVFYNGPGPEWSMYPCTTRCWPDVLGPGAWGCAVAPVTAIPATDKPTPGDIALLRPWHCLVCPCPMTRGTGSLPVRIASVLQLLYAGLGDTADVRFRDAPALSFELSNNAPPWVQMLEKLPEAEDQLEMYLKNNGLHGVALIGESSPDAEDGEGHRD